MEYRRFSWAKWQVRFGKMRHRAAGHVTCGAWRGPGASKCRGCVGVGGAARWAEGDRWSSARIAPVSGLRVTVGEGYAGSTVVFDSNRVQAILSPKVAVAVERYPAIQTERPGHDENAAEDERSRMTNDVAG